MILGISVEKDRIGIALRRNGEVVFEDFSAGVRNGVEQLPGLLQRAHSIFAEDFADGPAMLEAIGIMVGPGPYSGLRGAIAFVQGLAHAGRIPIVPINSRGEFVEGEVSSSPLPQNEMSASDIARLADKYYRKARFISTEHLRPIYGKPLTLKTFSPKPIPPVS